MILTGAVKLPMISGFLFDDDNIEKFASHGLSWQQVDQVLDSQHRVEPNRNRRRASHLVIGQDLAEPA